MSRLTLFNIFNTRVNDAACEVSKRMMYLLKPAGGYSEYSDILLEEKFDIWRAERRAMDAGCGTQYHTNTPMPKMLPADAEHALCRRMGAVMIEGLLWGEGTVEHYLTELIDPIEKSPDCYKHAATCPCHNTHGWTYKNLERVMRLKEALTLKRCVRPVAAARTVSDARDDLAKSLFETVQGVKFDSKCPHGMPFYACMPCNV